MICFLGMGLLGSNFTKALLQKGQQVNVWNRTFAKAKALETFGAKACENILDAVKNAERIHITLPDDKVVDEILEKAKSNLKPGCIIIDHSTTSTKGAKSVLSIGKNKALLIYMRLYLWGRKTHWKVQVTCWYQATKM